MNEPIPPCRHLCLSAKNGCEALLRKFGYQWPEIFDCDKLPEHGTDMCVGDNRTTTLDNSSEGGKEILRDIRPEFECPHTMRVVNRAK